MDGPYRLTTRKTAKDRIKGHYYYYYSKGELELRVCCTRREMRNKDKLQTYFKEYHQKNKEKKSAYLKKWREKNKEKLKQKMKEYAENNKEKIAERDRIRKLCSLCKLISGSRRFVSKENKKVRMCAGCFYHTYPEEKIKRDEKLKKEKEESARTYKARRDAANKKYRENNKEKIKQKAKKYRENNKEKIKKYYEKNKDKIIAKVKKYREKNKEKVQTQQKTHYQKNKEKIKQRVKKYAENNKEKIKKWHREYSARPENRKRAIQRTKCKKCKYISGELRFVSAENKKVRMCADCFYHTYPDEKKIPSKYKRKQHYIHEKLKETYGKDFFKYDKRVECGCSRKIPDWFCDCFHFVLNIECDEEQHKRNETSCENKRLMELFLDCANRPFVCLRFNPDKYTNNKGERVKGCFSFDTKNTLIVDQQEFERRWNILEEKIDHFLEYGPEKEVELEKLFYDEIKN